MLSAPLLNTGKKPVPVPKAICTSLRRAALGLFAPILQERRCVACTRVFLPEGIQKYAEGSSRKGTDAAHSLFCPDCTCELTRRSAGFCPCCGELAAWPQLPVAPCMRCLQKPPLWRGFIFHGTHEGLLRHLLLRLKFGSQSILAHALGSLLAQHPALPGLPADMIIPVPLHPRRLAQRGYNQALELARPLARSLDVPLAAHLLRRSRATLPQTGKTRQARMANTQDAFSAGPEVRGKHILLVDDTVTTGATLTAATRSLLAAGAASASVAAISRTPVQRGR